MAGSRASVAAAAGFTQDGKQQSLECDFVVGADGSRTFTRYLSAPTSSGNARSPGSDPLRGAALVRRAHLRAVRPGFRADLRTTRAGRSFDRRLAPPGASVKTGKAFKRDVLLFRSCVCEPMQHGRLYLVGHAAHTIPPTGAKVLLQLANRLAQRRLGRLVPGRGRPKVQFFGEP